MPDKSRTAARAAAGLDENMEVLHMKRVLILFLSLVMLLSAAGSLAEDAAAESAGSAA